MIKQLIESWLSSWDIVWNDNGSSYALCCGNALSIIYVSDVSRMIDSTPKANQQAEFDKMIAGLKWNTVVVLPEWANKEWEQLKFEV